MLGPDVPEALVLGQGPRQVDDREQVRDLEWGQDLHLLHQRVLVVAVTLPDGLSRKLSSSDEQKPVLRLLSYVAALMMIPHVIIINGPVTQITTLRRYYLLLARVANQAGPIHRGVCIGTYRFMYKVKYERSYSAVEFSQHPNVIDNPFDEDQGRIYSFVTSPIVLMTPYLFPVNVLVNFKDKGIN